MDEIFDKIAEQLLHRYDIQKNLKVKDFPFLMGQKLYLGSENMENDDKIEDAIKHGTLQFHLQSCKKTTILIPGPSTIESFKICAYLIVYYTSMCFTLFFSLCFLCIIKHFKGR